MALPLTQCSVLLVDDEPLILDLYAAALRQRGFTVHLATDAATARAINERARPNVTCIDGCMINESGANLARRLIKVNTRPAELADRLLEILAGVETSRRK